MKKLILTAFICTMVPMIGSAHQDHVLGSWYMYFYNTKFGKSPWGIQGDVQYRNWNIFGDLEGAIFRD